MLDIVVDIFWLMFHKITPRSLIFIKLWLVNCGNVAKKIK